MNKIAVLVLLLCFLTPRILDAQSKPTQKEIFASTYLKSKETIKTQQFKYVGKVVYNHEKREQLDGDANTFNVDNDEFNGSLSALNSYVYSTNGLKQKISNYKVLFNDEKQEITIQFNVNKTNFHIEIKPNGHAFLTLKSGVNNIKQTGKIEQI